jgi:uncharacterized membrane protein
VQRIRNHFRHHWHFYLAALIGGLAFLFAGSLTGPERALAAGDSFFAAYLAAGIAAIYQIDTDGLRKKAAAEDEGIFLVILIALVVIGISSLSIVTVLREKHAPSPLALSLAIAGAPLGWISLHTIAAFHYANLYYGRRGDAKNAQSVRGLEFKNTKDPGIWEFLYYAFTIGMTAQTSDTEVTDTKMRRATLGHSVVSFFYNTAIIAMAVNAVVAVAS